MKSFKQFLAEKQSEEDFIKRVEREIESNPEINDLIDQIDKGPDEENLDENDQMLFEGSTNSPFDVSDEDLYFSGDEIEEVDEGCCEYDRKKTYGNDYVTESMTTDYLEQTKNSTDLKNKKFRTSKEVADQAAQYKMVPDASSESGYTIHRKSGRFNSERHEISNQKRKGENDQEIQSEIQDILDQLNRPPVVNHFSYDENGTLMRNGKKMNIKSKNKWIKILNDIYRKTVNPDTFFQFPVLKDENGNPILTAKGEEKLGNNLERNVSKLKPDKDHPKLLDKNSSDYTTPNEEELKKVVKILEIVDNHKKKENIVYGWDDDSKCFTADGVKITDRSALLKLITRLNGGVKQADDEKWTHFVFAKEGSKIGKHTGSFSLPPIDTCMPGVPCAKQGCYAIKSYALRPQVAACWDNNAALLREGKYEQFINEAVSFINEKKLTHFRFHVSGDTHNVGDGYVDAIMKIVESCPNVLFWTYTKNYDSYRGKKPSKGSLVVIMSAWGEFQPPKDMLKEYPVAFLYDENDTKIKDYVPEIEKEDGDGGLKICPCTVKNNPEHVTCESCEICFTRKAYNNLAFNKH